MLPMAMRHIPTHKRNQTLLQCSVYNVKDRLKGILDEQFMNILTIF
jgi:hypothetical protein